MLKIRMAIILGKTNLEREDIETIINEYSKEQNIDFKQWTVYSL